MAAGQAAERVTEGVDEGEGVMDEEREVEPVSDAVGDALAPNDSVAVPEAEAVLEPVSDVVDVTVAVPVRVGVRESV
jgi:hypothetical protein